MPQPGYHQGRIENKRNGQRQGKVIQLKWIEMSNLHSRTLNTQLYSTCHFSNIINVLYVMDINFLSFYDLSVEAFGIVGP